MKRVSLFWFRRDLRLHDNAGLYRALRSGNAVVPIFIFDNNILAELENKKDKRVDFIHRSLTAIQQELEKTGSTLHVLHGTPEECYQQLIKEYDVTAVYTNHDYEPYAAERDKKIAGYLASKDIAFYSFKDQVIFEKR